MKTADGWKSKSHVKNQGARTACRRMACRRLAAACPGLLTAHALLAEKAWRKARAKLQDVIGEDCMISKAALSEKAEAIFRSIDTDNSGGLDAPELKECFGRAGVELTNAEAKAMVVEADENGCAPALVLPPGLARQRGPAPHHDALLPAPQKRDHRPVGVQEADGRGGEAVASAAAVECLRDSMIGKQAAFFAGAAPEFHVRGGISLLACDGVCFHLYFHFKHQLPCLIPYPPVQLYPRTLTH